MSLATISLQEFEAFRDFLEGSCGILLGENKQYLIQSRLGRILATESINSLGDLLARLRSNPDQNRLREQIVEAMTTNETLWFRDGHPFEILTNDVLPELAARKVRTPRIWSAACSTGQEPYSISMTAQTYINKNPNDFSDVQIVATDISTAVLDEASQGSYEALALSRGLSAAHKDRYFQKLESDPDERWSIKPEIRKRVRFSYANLLESYASLGKFDVIYCRNVLIYFSSQLKTDIINRMAAALNEGGYMFFGTSESINRYTDACEMIRCDSGVVYQKK